MTKRWYGAANLRPGVVTGKHPDTGVIHRITIRTDGSCLIERQPYVSPVDGWTQTYPDLHCQAAKHDFLILKLRANPCDWPG